MCEKCKCVHCLHVCVCACTATVRLRVCVCVCVSQADRQPLLMNLVAWRKNLSWRLQVWADDIYINLTKNTPETGCCAPMNPLILLKIIFTKKMSLLFLLNSDVFLGEIIIILLAESHAEEVCFSAPSIVRRSVPSKQCIILLIGLCL